jgi:hypothetical protein
MSLNRVPGSAGGAPGAGRFAPRDNRFVCLRLCCNPPGPTHIRIGGKVSLGLRWQSANRSLGRMNTANQCHSGLLRLVSSENEMRNGMEEVVGSIPTRSTKSLPCPPSTSCKVKARTDSTSVVPKSP